MVIRLLMMVNDPTRTAWYGSTDPGTIQPNRTIDNEILNNAAVTNTDTYNITVPTPS